VQEGVTDEIVMALADFANAPQFSAREKLALQFAERMALNHHQIDDQFFRTLRNEFNAAEILELGMLTGLFIGYGRLLSILDLENPSTTP
jgi:alkylhydroperoxidase family enzyme